MRALTALAFPCVKFLGSHRQDLGSWRGKSKPCPRGWDSQACAARWHTSGLWAVGAHTPRSRCGAHTDSPVSLRGPCEEAQRGPDPEAPLGLCGLGRKHCPQNPQNRSQMKEVRRAPVEQEVLPAPRETRAATPPGAAEPRPGNQSP